MTEHRSWLRRVSRPLLVFADRVLLEPVRDGRLRNTGWPAGLASISGLALIVYTATGTMLVLSPWLRRFMPMYIGSNGTPRPYLGLAMLFGGITFAIALIQTAALHGHWLLRLAGTLVTVVVMTAMGIALPSSLMKPVVIPSLLALVALIVLVFVRARRRFAWWEFAVVFGLVSLGCLVPPMLVALRGAVYGIDVRPTISDFNMLLLFSVTVPAMLVAGAALTEIAVTSAHWGLTLMRQGRSPRVWVILIALVVLARIAQMLVGYRDDPSLWTLSGALTATCVVLACLGAVLGLERLARRRTGQRHTVPSPVDMAEDWMPIRSAIAGVMFAVLILFLGSSVVSLLLSVFKIRVDLVSTFGRLIGGQGQLAVGQAVLTVVAGVAAVILARRGRLGHALILVAIMVTYFSWTLLRMPYVRRYMPAWTAEELGAVMALLAVGLLVFFAIRRTLDDRRVFALVLMFALGITYDLRDILDEPLSWVLGFSGVAVAFFGLIWRVLTDGSFARGDTERFPRPSRVMFFWANALLAVIALTQVAMGRETGSVFDLTVWVNSGDLIIGRPFYVAALVACLWEALRPGPALDDSAPDGDPGVGELDHEVGHPLRGDRGGQVDEHRGVETR